MFVRSSFRPTSLVPRASLWVGLMLAAGLLAGAKHEAKPESSEPERTSLPPAPPRHKSHPDALFADDFSNGKLDGWTADKPGVWSVWHGVLRADLPDGRQQRSFLYAGSTEWTDVAVDLDVCGMRGVDKGVAVRVNGKRGIGVDLRGPGYQDVVVYRGDWPLGKASTLNANGMWHHLRVEARGNRYRVFVNGELLIDRVDNHKSFPAGRIALPAYTGGVGQCTVYYDNVVVTPISETSASNER